MLHFLPVIFIVITVLAVLYLIRVRNHFVILRNRVKDQQSQIVVQLKRRYDLIPNLVETARGYAGFEKSTLEAVTAVRTKAYNTSSLNEEIAVNNEMNRALGRLFAVSETYPDLKANQNFMHLQQELSATEDKVAKARQFYNDSVLKYNTALELFPSNLVAGLLNYRPYEFLDTEEHEKQAVKLDSGSFRL